jgi:hypothetical protein
VLVHDKTSSELLGRPPAATARHARRIPRWLRIVGLIIAAVLIVGIVILATHWPFSEEAMRRSIQTATSRPVEIGAFHTSYFPPGCLAEKVRVLHNGDPQGPPLITIEKLMVTASFTGMFSPKKRLSEVKVVGMRVIVPPKDGKHGTAKFALDTGGNSLAISKIVADGAVLDFGDYRLKIDALKLLGVGSGEPWSYDAILTNSTPPGVIKAKGKFGPWKPDNPGVTPVSGDYIYSDGNLGVFHGISGIFQAKGKFEGPLSRIVTDGTIEVAKFHVENSASSVPLRVSYHALVNGTNGDTTLDPADVRFLRTRVVVRGPIAGRKGEDGKTVTLDVSVPNGRIDDLLRLFVDDPKAPLSGAVQLHGKFVWPPGPGKFVKKIRMDLGFGIDGGKFQSETTQATIDRISNSAQHEKDDPRTALSELRGQVAFRGGVATFRNVSFQVTGASSKIHGTYGLVDNRVDLHGVLTTTGKLSDATDGFFKKLLVKAITPFFKKKNEVKVVPFKITGTFKDASVGLD